MKLLRCLMIGLAIIGLTLADSSESSAQFPNKFQKKKKLTPFRPQVNPAAKPGAAQPGAAKPMESAADEVDIFAPNLLAADFVAKLKLNATQKTEGAKIQTEFAAKLKEAVAQAKEDAAKNGAAKGGDKGKFKGKGQAGGGAPATPGLSEAIGLRTDYEAKVYDILDEAQQKVWLDIKAKKGEGLLTGGGAAAKTPNKK